MRKMLLNQVRERFDAIIKRRVVGFRNSLKYNPEPTREAARTEAAKIPKVFTAIALAMYDKAQWNDISLVLEKMPGYIKIQARYNATEEKNAEAIERLTTALQEESFRIMDSLYFDETRDALAEIAKFKKFKPETKKPGPC